MKRLPLFEEKNKINLIVKQCETIATGLSNYYSEEKEPGWMNGLAGISCFFFHYSRFSGNDKYKNLGYHVLEKILSVIEKGFTHPSFATGLSGINWTFNYLGDQGFISSDEANSLNGLNQMFENFAREQFRAGEYDFLHSALGVIPTEKTIKQIGNTPEKDSGSDGMISMIINELTRIAIHFDDQTISWTSTNLLKGYKEINFGLAHGIPSILLILSRIYKITGDNSILANLIEPGMKFLFDHQLESPDDLSYFPIRIKNGHAQRPSRMAWCYGDPGIALAIHQIGENCVRPTWQANAIKILKSASSRLSQVDTGITDACICHGSSGLALIYYSVARKTGYEPFLETARHWTLRTLDFGNNQQGSAGYLFKGNFNKYLPNYNFLEGITGVGLTLIAMLEGELPGWEKGLMV